MTEFIEKIYKFVWIPRGRVLLPLFVVAFLIGFYDVIFDLAMSFVHASFEWLEFALEEMIESVFHTTRKQTQTIVFYMFISVGAGLCYYLARKMIDLYHYWTKKIIELAEAYKLRMLHIWKRLSIWQKLKIILSSTAGIGVIVYLSLN
ncbi:MAG: hypothetical protein ACU84H_14285 [Gammaproteobacteria bacterium]